jgi:hypothetical protein
VPEIKRKEDFRISEGYYNNNSSIVKNPLAQIQISNPHLETKHHKEDNYN